MSKYKLDVSNGTVLQIQLYTITYKIKLLFIKSKVEVL